MTVPRKKRLIGHGKKEDVYETPSGKIYLYSGTKREHWKSPKFWKRAR